MEIFFEVPMFKEITSHKNWEKGDKKTEFFIARAFFKVVTSHMAGASRIGRKLEPFGSPKKHERFKRIVSEREILNEKKTIEKSLVESQALDKLVTEVSGKLGFGRQAEVRAKAATELATIIKNSFHKEFQITQVEKERKEITYEFKDKIAKDDIDRLCYAEVYQECRADLYLLRVDYLCVYYVKTKLGLRKKITKKPFPEKVNKIEYHPNIIRFGTPLAELNYWQLLPGASVVIKDAEYVQEVENDSEIIVKPPRQGLIDRPYWSPPKYPSLYQISRVAFPTRYIDIKDDEFTRDELIDHEYGEAEETAWWYLYGPGNKKANK